MTKNYDEYDGYFPTPPFLLVVCLVTLIILSCIGCASPDLREAQRTCQHGDVGVYEYHTRHVDVLLECK